MNKGGGVSYLAGACFRPPFSFWGVFLGGGIVVRNVVDFIELMPPGVYPTAIIDIKHGPGVCCRFMVL